MKVENILDTIGRTPHVKINKLFRNNLHVWMKIEKTNPGGSVKDRVALNMILEAEMEGLLSAGKVIVEPTSGNTGIGLALVAAVKGYHLILVMPESMSLERRKCLAAYGAEIVLTPADAGMIGAIKKAEELVQEKNAWMPQQFNNFANPEAHKKATAHEILEDFGNNLNYFFSAVGTGGQLTGIGSELKKYNPNLKIVAVEPDTSAVLSGGQAGQHALQGIGAGFIPNTLDIKLIDEVICVSKNEAYEYTKRCAREEGILVGISTGATLAAIAKKTFVSDCSILLLAYDSGERYLSTEGLFD